jgi:hypothetical protein
MFSENMPPRQYVVERQMFLVVSGHKSFEQGRHNIFTEFRTKHVLLATDADADADRRPCGRGSTLV